TNRILAEPKCPYHGSGSARGESRLGLFCRTTTLQGCSRRSLLRHMSTFGHVEMWTARWRRGNVSTLIPSPSGRRFPRTGAEPASPIICASILTSNRSGLVLGDVGCYWPSWWDTNVRE